MNLSPSIHSLSQLASFPPSLRCLRLHQDPFSFLLYLHPRIGTLKYTQNHKIEQEYMGLDMRFKAAYSFSEDVHTH